MLFLEEDHYLSPDTLHVLALMAKQHDDSKVDILNLGMQNPR